MTADALPSRYLGAEDRIPTWEAFTGPDHGVVRLPHRLAWSGPTAYDDIATYVNRTLLSTDWPNMRRLTSRELISIWEHHLPALAAA